MIKPKKSSSRSWLLLIPPLTVFSILLIFPLANVLDQSFREFKGGSIGAANDAPYTLSNYADLLDPAYFYFFFQTFRLALVGTAISITLSFPIAYLIARMRSQLWRSISMGGLIAVISVSTLVRVYSLLLTLGPVGYGRQLSSLLDMSPNSTAYTEIMVLAGLVYFHTPVSALILLGTIQNISPSLVEAAQSLGASRWKSHFTVTIPLSLHGIIAASLISFAVCVSAFVIPLILGKGKVLFVSNLIYNRFGEVSNYPSGSALSMSLLAIAIVLVAVLPWLMSFLNRAPVER